MDIVTMMQTVAPVKAGVGIGAIAFIYGAVRMEFSFGVLGFFLCLITGFIAELFV